MTWRGSEEFARERGEIFRLLKGMVRRLAVTLAEGGIWQVLGQHGGAGGDETNDVELFGGIGFHSRPPSSGKPEAIAVAVGGAKHQAIVATRDEATRQAVAGDLQEDGAAIFNSQAIVRVEGSRIEARSATGNASPVATLADLQALRDYVDAQLSATGGHTHTVAGGTTTAIVTVVSGTTPPTHPPPAPNGTEIFQAE